MSQISRKLDFDICTYQSLHNHSNFIEPIKENLQIDILVYNNDRLPNFNETFLYSKHATLWFKYSETVSFLSN